MKSEKINSSKYVWFGLMLSSFAILAVVISLTPMALESPSPQANGLFGVAVAGIGDLNGDGIHEVIVGSSEDAVGVAGSGRVYVFNGVTLDTLFTLTSPFPQSGGRIGNSLADAGDVNNDGISDILVGAQLEDVNGIRDAGRAYLFDGATGDTLFTMQTLFPEAFGNFSAAVAGAGDVNNDGWNDVIIGAEREDNAGLSNAGRVYVYSGATGDTLFTLTSIQPEVGGLFGISVAGAGDVNKDGHADLLIGSLENGGGFQNAGRAYLVSGASRDTLFVFDTPFPRTDGAFGREVAGVGDLNGDDTSDVAIAAPGELFRVYVYSGASGDTLFTLKSPSQQNIGFGSSLASAGDVDNDGVNDIIVGAPSEFWGGLNNAGRAYIYSGATGMLLHSLQSSNPQLDAFFGNWVSGAGILSNDDSSDVIIGAHGEDVSGLQSAGRAYVFKSGAPTSISPQPGSAPKTFELAQNYPNPFNPSTTFRFSLAEPGFTQLKVYNAGGEIVATLISQKLPAGRYSYSWDAGNLASGVYFYRLEGGRFYQTRKLVLLR